MKSQIICKQCNHDFPNLFDNKDDESLGEHIKNVVGFSKQDCMCDFCGRGIRKNSVCSANSIWSDHGGQPYYKWESDYINPMEKESNNGEE